MKRWQGMSNKVDQKSSPCSCRSFKMEHTECSELSWKEWKCLRDTWETERSVVIRIKTQRYWESRWWEGTARPWKSAADALRIQAKDQRSRGSRGWRAVSGKSDDSPWFSGHYPCMLTCTASLPNIRWHMSRKGDKGWTLNTAEFTPKCFIPALWNHTKMSRFGIFKNQVEMRLDEQIKIISKRENT